MSSKKLIADSNIDAVLCLADGNYFFGKGIGKKNHTIGEICFNTSITGYQEILTDPSYSNQIITFTFPHIGNVGFNNCDQESKKVQSCGLIISQPITIDSNYRSEGNLNDWLVKNNVTGISGVDTRALTKNIRENGAQNAIIHYVKEGETLDVEALVAKIANLETLKGMELAKKVTTDSVYNYEKSTYDITNNAYKEPALKKYKVAVIDYGVKANILKELVNAGCEVKVFPCDAVYEVIKEYNPDGVFLSNGPGDPLATSSYALDLIKEVLDNNIPIFGICMGHQLLSLALGLKTIKMHQGHRGANHPVMNLATKKVEITSQNHGFCVSKDNLPDNVKITHLSLFDNTVQGIELKDKLAFSVQYHPESSPGPHDSKYLFEKFIALIDKSKN